VFHVPSRSTLQHPRLTAFIGRPDSVELVRRVHRGFGRLFLTQMRERNAARVSESGSGQPMSTPDV
jgi:hypothetical protein